MQSQALARRYATAVFELARASDGIAAVGSDVRAAKNAIYGNDDVRRFYLSPVFERSKKEALLKSVFAGKLGEIALNTVLLLVRKRREAILPGIADAYDELALAAAGKERLEIVSARELVGGDIEAIVARLGRSAGTTYDVSTRIDPSLLGGLRITTHDRQVDGSLAARIDDIARDLFATNLNDRTTP